MCGYGLRHEEIRAPKLASVAHVPESGLAGANRRPERRLAARSAAEPVGDIQLNSSVELRASAITSKFSEPPTKVFAELTVAPLETRSDGQGRNSQ